MKEEKEHPLTTLHKIAEEGNEFAQEALAKMYLEGDGVEQDLQEAAKWEQMALGKNHNASVDDTYAMRDEVQQTLEAPLKWYQKIIRQIKFLFSRKRNH